MKLIEIRKKQHLQLTPQQCRISFTKTPKSNFYSVDLVLGEDMCNLLKIKLLDRIQVFYDQENIHNIVIKKASMEGYLLRKRSFGTVYARITWKLFTPTASERSMHLVKWEKCEEGVLIHL